MNTEEFIARATEKHNGKFNYSKTEYVRSHDKVTIICPTHGAFEQKAYSHLNGRGCAKCSGIKKHTTATFISEAIKVHGDKYDYSTVEYHGNKRKVAITCKEHGAFYQVPNSHLTGRGCPKCAKTAYKTEKIGYVYTLLSVCGRYMKTGITNRRHERFSELRGKTPFEFIVIDVYCMKGAFAPVIEKGMHAIAKNAGLRGFDGATEWFNYDLELEYILYQVAKALEG